jgi:mannose-6-phosphate isomerase-like protein (cupin superfamily)
VEVNMSSKARTKADHKSFSRPDEIRSFEKGKLELIQMGGGEVGRLILEPGWQWSKHVKPIAKTEWCMAPHFQYTISGRLHVKMKSGEEFELGPGDASYLPEGHDAWVVGNDPVVVIDWAGATNYAKGK